MTRNPFLDRCLEISRNNLNLRRDLRIALSELGQTTKSVNHLMVVALLGWGLAVALLVGWCP